MTGQQNDPPNDDDRDGFPRALIHAEETVRDALAEGLDGKERNSTRQWLKPSLAAALMLIGAAGLAYKVINGYRRASPEAFVSVEDQNRRPAVSIANQSVEAPTASAAIAPNATTAVTVPAATNTAAPPPASKDDLESALSGATNANSAERDDPDCEAIKTEQHEIEAALNKQHSSEEGHYMQRRFRELTEQSGKQRCHD
jgi:hypothetical protein